MSTPCTVSDVNDIAKGDAVCVVDYDTDHSRPKVGRATAANLATSNTVFGVALADAANGTLIHILVAGEVAEESLTGLGAGDSRIIVTDYTNATDANQCKLNRIGDTSGNTVPPRKEVYVVGTCDKNGNLVIQPRHSSDETGFPKVYNVCAYGAVPDWNGMTGTDNLAAFNTCLAAMAADGNLGGKLVARGAFFLSNTLDLVHTIIFEGDGANEPNFGTGARSAPGTWLVFPKNVTGIRVHSAAELDNPASTAALGKTSTLLCTPRERLDFDFTSVFGVLAFTFDSVNLQKIINI